MNCVVERKEASPRMIWIIMRLGKEKWVFVNGYGSESQKKQEKRSTIWDDLCESVLGRA